MVTFQIDRGRKRATTDSIAPVSQELWAAVEQDCGPYEESPPDSIVRPELILDAALKNERAKLKEMIESWIEIPSHVWRAAVWSAAGSGSMAVIELFLEKWALLEQVALLRDNPVWCLALYHAAESGHLPVVELLLKRQLAQMQELHVVSSLYIAATNGYLGICKILFQYCKHQISYEERVSACLAWGSTHSSVEEVLFLLGGENFDLYSRQELRDLMGCLYRPFLHVISQDINPNAISILSVLMREMRRGEKSLPLLQEWLETYAVLDTTHRLLKIVLNLRIPVTSVARRIFILRVFGNGDWRWGNPKIVAHPDIRLVESIEVALVEVVHPDALPLLEPIPQHPPNPNVHFLIDLRLRWQQSRNLALGMLFAPGPAMSRPDRGALLFQALLLTKSPYMVEEVLKSGEVFPGDWKKSRQVLDAGDEMGALLDKYRPRSIRLFFLEYWHRFSYWISRKWQALRS
jgi:hypothetical protein